MASQTITSDKQETKVGTAGTKVYTATRTTYSNDSNGKIDPKSVKHEILYYDSPTSQGVVAATSTGSSENWTFANNSSTGKPILGADAQKSLKTGALKTNTQQQVLSTATKANIPAEQQKSLSTKQLSVNANKASETGGTVTAAQISASAGKEKSGTRSEFKGAKGSDPLRYPLNLKSEFQDVIKFNMVKYSPKSFDEKKFGFSSREKAGESKNREIIGCVVLPVPGGISDTNSVSWGSADMNAAQALAANIAMTTIGQGASAGADQASSAIDTISNSSGDVKTAIKAAFTDAAVGTQGILTRTTGLVLNPNMELLFNAPTLRPFSFTFKMSARNPDEAKAIRSIIRFFKQGMAPIRTESNLFLKSPHTFQLQYLHRNKDHPFLNKFKECALQSFNVNYTPEAQYATFIDGAMVSYEIQMQFTELEPIFNDDYGNADNKPDTEIGY